MKRFFTLGIALLSFVFLRISANGQCFTLPTYCTNITASNVANYQMGIQNVTLGSTVNNTTSGGSGSPIYFDYTSMSVSAAANTSVSFSIKVGNSNSTTFRIYIDYNLDGTFATTSPELVYTSATSLAPNTIVSSSFTVPSGTASGIYRLRVASDGLSNIPGPCGPLTYSAEVEDYTLIVTSTGGDVASNAFTSPGLFIVGNNTIGFSFRNLSAATITTVDVGYQLGSNSPVTQSLTGLSIGSGALYTHTFSTQMAVGSVGNFNMKAWATNANSSGSVTPENDTICRSFTTYCNSALSGTYTINPSGSGSTNFKTFGAADSALISCGVSGPVEFIVGAGTYTTQMDIPSITGASATNTITFNGGAGNASTRILAFAGTAANPYTLRFNGCSYVTFKNMTIRGTGTTDAWVVHFYNGTYNRVNNCVIEINGSGATATNSNLVPIVINGSYTSLGTSTSTANNHTIDSNTVTAGYYNLYCSESNGANTHYISYNSFSSAYFYGLYFNSSVTAKILNNTINMRTTATNNIGIYFINNNASGANYHEIRNNKILNAGQYGMQFLTSSGSGSAYGQIYNNFIGGGFRSTGGYFGISDNSSRYQIWHNSINLDFTSTSGTSAAIYLTGGSLHDIQNNHLVVSNATAFAAYPLWCSNTSYISVLDYNNYYNASSSNLLNLAGINYTPLNFKVAFSSGGGLNSINTNPFFASSTNLHTSAPCNNGAMLGLTTDIDGDTRATVPDIGADEMTSIPNNDIGVLKINAPGFPFAAGTQSINITIRNFGNNTVTSATLNYSVNGGTPVTQSWTGSLSPCDTANVTFTSTYSFGSGSSVLKAFTTGPNGSTDANASNDTVTVTLCPAMSGTYTINPTGSGSTNFTSFSNAIGALTCGGMTGAVTFNVSAGTYNEQISIPQVQGLSATNTITIDGGTGNAATRILTFAGTANAPTTLTFNGANYVTVKNITIQTTGTSQGWCVDFMNATNCRLSNCIVDVGAPGNVSTSSNFAGIIMSAGTTPGTMSTQSAVIDNNMVDSNTVNAGYYGIYTSLNNSVLTNYFIKNSVLNTYQNALYFNGNQTVKARYNTINMRTATAGNDGITLFNCNSGGSAYHELLGNLIQNAGNRGIYMATSVGGGSTPGQMYNNMIGGGFRNTTAYGIYTTSSTWNIYHNTINFDAPATGTCAALYFASGNTNNVKNNIFAVTNTATASVYCVYTASTTYITTLDNNDYYNKLGANLLYLGGSTYTATTYKAAYTAGGGLNSFNTDPNLVSNMNLHVLNPCNNGAALGVTTDIDGDTRSTTAPDMGADEIPAYSYDAAVIAIRTPTGTVVTGGTPYAVKITVRNNGSTTITSLVANYSINGTPTTETFTTSSGLPAGGLLSCDTIQLTFTSSAVFGSGGPSFFKAYTGAVNGSADQFNLNDTLSKLFCTPFSGSFTINSLAPASNTNFQSFTAAVNAVYGCGITGPVVFRVVPGSGPYNEQITLTNNIPGASVVNNVTFKGGATRETIQFNASIAASAHTIRLSNVKHVIFDSLTINALNVTNGVGVNITNTSDSNYVTNCVLNIAGSNASNTAGITISGTGSPSTSGTNGNKNIIMNNVINGGYFGITANGSSSSVFNLNNQIVGNTINNVYYYGIYMQYQDLATINKNTISGNPNNVSSYGVYLYYVDRFDLSKNKINNIGAYGLYLYYANYQNGTGMNRARMTNNMVGGTWYGTNPYGIYLNTYTRELDVFHNSVSLNNTGSGYAFFLQQTSAGQYSGIDVRNNSLVTYNTNSYAGWFYYATSTTSPFLNLNFNNIWNSNTGATQVVISQSGYNTNGWIGALGYNSNSKWGDPLYLNPANDLHSLGAWLDNSGTNISSVADDIDGDVRPIPPSSIVDIGADEYNQPANDAGAIAIISPAPALVPGLQDVIVQIKNFGTNTLTSANVSYKVGINGSVKTQGWTGSLVKGATANVTFTGANQYNFTGTQTDTIIAWTSLPNGVTDEYKANDTTRSPICSALTGSYTINPAGSGSTNFLNFASAIARLMNCGVGGPVTFTVAPGTYTEKITIGAIPNSSATNTITFNGTDSATTKLTDVATAANNPAVITLSNAKYVNFKNFTIWAQGTTIGVGVLINNNSAYNRISSCLIRVSETSTSGNCFGFGVCGTSYSATGNGTYNYFEDNTVIGGYVGASLYGTSSTVNDNGNVIRRNKFLNMYYTGINSYYQNIDSILDNTIRFRVGASTTNYGIYMYYNNQVRAERNIIYNASYMGLYAYFCNQNGPSRMAINNNIIVTNGTYSTSYTLYALYCYNSDFYHNTIYSSGTPTTAYGAYISYGTGMNVKNNIMYNGVAGGNTFAFYVPSTSGFNNFDYNNVYSVGGATNLCYWGVAQADLTALKAAGTPTYFQKTVSSLPNFISTILGAEDCHLTAYSPAEIGDNSVVLGIDVDRDVRCPFSATIGADESKFASIPPVAGFTLPDTIWVSSPVTFLNNSSKNAPLGHFWWIGSTLQGTMLNLSTIFNTPGTYTVSLKTWGCGGADSIGKIITVYTPTMKPVSDFIADVNVVETYAPVQLTNLSTKGPVYSYWTFIPATGVNFNNGTTSTSMNPNISFSSPGLYTICLWDSNAAGRSVQVCKTNYIRVNATNQMCIFPFDTKAPSGTIYDDGGPNGNYGNSHNPPCTFLIDPCASSVNMIFSQFNLAAGDYLRVFDGRDKFGKALHTGLGFTGTSLPGGVAGLTALSGKMYIEFQTDANTNAPGFAATWTSVAGSFPAPTGKIKMPDTVYDCGALFDISFETDNQNFPYQDAYYRWFFDYGNSNLFPDIEGKGAFIQNWSYGSTGSYIIHCEVEGCNGTLYLTDTIIVDHPSTGPKVDFKANLRTATPNDVVTFTDLSTLDPTYWQWTFTGPGSIVYAAGNANSKNPGVKFTAVGTYSVTLMDSNCVGSNSLTKTSYITIIDYCVPSVGILNPDFAIENVKIGRADTLIKGTVQGLDWTNTSPAIGTVPYRDNTGQTVTYQVGVISITKNLEAVVGIGSVVPFSVTRASNFNAANFKIWIDYNQDGTFDPTTELASFSGLTSGITFSGNISIPGSAKLGYTRMRIGTSFENQSNTPCGINAYGDFNDYRLLITGDETAPVITFNGGTANNPLTVFVEVGRTFNDPGFTVTDDVTMPCPYTRTGIANGTVITKHPSTQSYTITATDASNNVSINTLTVKSLADTTKPVIVMKYISPVYVEVNSSYTDSGATASDFFFGNFTSQIVTVSNVNTSKIGTYTVTYDVTDSSGNKADRVTRTVIVRDTQKPVITITGGNTIILDVFSSFNLPAATVTDNYNSNLTYTVTGGPVNTNVLGTYTYNYDAVDSSGNAAITQVLTVIVKDRVAPEFTMIPPDTFVIDVNTLTTVPEPGYLLRDNYYPNSQLTVVPKGTVNLNVIGVYSIKYIVSDPSGNYDSSHERVYKVVDRIAPVITLKGAITYNWPRWKNYVDPGYTVTDNYDPSVTVTVNSTNVNIMLEGLYEVTFNATDASGNKATEVKRYVNIYTPTGINAPASENSFTVYPNPSRGTINALLNIPNVATAHVTIYDAQGRLVYSGDVLNPAKADVAIDLSKQAGGMYYIQVTAEGYSASKAFSIVK